MQMPDSLTMGGMKGDVPPGACLRLPHPWRTCPSGVMGGGSPGTGGMPLFPARPVGLLRGLGLLRDRLLFRTAAVLSGNAEGLDFEIAKWLLPVARIRGLDQMGFLGNCQFNGNASTLLANADWPPAGNPPIAG